MSKRMTGNNFEVLLTRIFSVPWQISSVLAVEMLVVMRWIAPATFNTHALRAIGNELFIFAPAVALLFLVYAALSYLLNSALVKRLVQVDEKTLELPAFEN